MLIFANSKAWSNCLFIAKIRERGLSIKAKASINSIFPKLGDKMVENTW